MQPLQGLYRWTTFLGLSRREATWCRRGREALRRRYWLWHVITDVARGWRSDKEALKSAVSVLWAHPLPAGHCHTEWTVALFYLLPITDLPTSQVELLCSLPITLPGEQSGQWMRLCWDIRDPLHAATLVLGSRRSPCHVSLAARGPVSLWSWWCWQPWAVWPWPGYFMSL